MNPLDRENIIMAIIVFLFVYDCLVSLVKQSQAIRASGNQIMTVYHFFFFFSIFALLIALVIQEIKLANAAKYTDRMTGVPNSEWITHKGGFLYHQKKLGNYTAFFLNIKDCKYINQKYGNQNGDKVIEEFAHKLKDIVKSRGYMGRMGGDNFLLYVRNEHADSLRKSLKNITVLVEIEGKEEVEIPIKVRCGISVCNQEIPYRENINRASAALARSKEQGPDMVFFEEHMIKELMVSRDMINACKLGMENQEFVAYYQPKVDAITNRLCGAEALARWVRDGKLVPPAEFVPILEKDGLITQLDLYIFEKVCKDIKSWETRGLQPVCISSNFSKKHLLDPDFANKIIAIKNRYDVDGKYLEIELTESSGSEDFKVLQNFASQIRNAGMRIAIDDFGTGYSSLSMLREFRADVIKLDKSFLDSATDGKEENKLFIQDIIHMIANQKEYILCEGVERKEQLDFLVESGCHIIQGYYFDRPLAIDNFEERLKNSLYVR